ncbi:MAG: hypothetical protein H7316_05720 [Tardiphaga sp.]|nr:hypothetical protein [Tardiphaga sp.]
MRARPPRLLAVTATAAALAIVANGVGAVTPAIVPPATRLGVAIQQDVATQAATAAQRSRTLDLREQAARATELRLKADLAAREAAASKPDAATDAAAAGAQYNSLARVYQAMKPARAAPVFEQLGMDVQIQVARRMRDRAIAMILASMTPKGAADLSMALAGKSAIPDGRAPPTTSASLVPPPPASPAKTPAKTPEQPVAKGT